MDDDDDEGDAGEAVAGALVVTCDDGAPVLEAAEGALDGRQAMGWKAGLWMRFGIGEMTPPVPGAARNWRRPSASWALSPISTTTGTCPPKKSKQGAWGNSFPQPCFPARWPKPPSRCTLRAADGKL
jgi:hypothetical protein